MRTRPRRLTSRIASSSPRVFASRRCQAAPLAAGLVLCAALALACGSTTFVDASGTRIGPGSRAVTLVNLHVRPGKNVMTSVNNQYEQLIPVCTEVKIFEIGRNRMGFRAGSNPEAYSFRYHRAAAEPFEQNLARYFGTRCPGQQIDRMSRIDQHGIELGRPFIGMSKQGILIAMGPPPKHRTPTLSSNAWLYWGNRRKNNVTFDGRGFVTSVGGLPRSAITPPAHVLQQHAQARAPYPGPRQGSHQRYGRQTGYAPTPPQGARRAPVVKTIETGDDRLYSKRVAVVIGINDYERWPSLTGASGDGHRMAEYLRREGWDEVIEVYDSEATRRRMLKVLGTELPRLTDENTLAMIYFAGHGQTETLPSGGKRGYLIPVDGDTQDVFSTAISMDTVRDLSKRTPAKHVYYAIDACYSGLALTRGIPVSGPPDIYLKKITSRPAVQVITAGGEGEQALEIGGQGLFTTYLLRAISGEADANNDGAVTASEIGTYVKPQVTNASRSQQTPQFGTMEGTGEIVFTLSH